MRESTTKILSKLNFEQLKNFYILHTSTYITKCYNSDQTVQITTSSITLTTQTIHNSHFPGLAGHGFGICYRQTEVANVSSLQVLSLQGRLYLYRT